MIPMSNSDNSIEINNIEAPDDGNLYMWNEESNSWEVPNAR
jgi:hypothetical protein